MARDSRGFDPLEQREASLGEAVLRVYEAGQALTLRHLELWLAEARELARSGIVMLFAGSVAFAGWFYFIAGVIGALSREVPRFAVEMSVGGFFVAVAFALFALARRGGAKPGRHS
jgi:membrane associated rhomboid family serine protease